MVSFYKKWKKYNEIQLTKKNGLKYSKNDKSSNLPELKKIIVKLIPVETFRTRSRFYTLETLVFYLRDEVLEYLIFLQVRHLADTAEVECVI